MPPGGFPWVLKTGLTVYKKIWPVVSLKHDTPKVYHLRMFETYAD